MNFSPSPVLALRLPVWRSRLVLAVLLLGFVALIGRALYLQGIHNDFLQQKGESRYSRVIEIGATRGKITDRHGEALAISTPVKSIWAIPSDVNATAEQSMKLARMLEIAPDELTRKLSNGDRDFVYLKRQVPPEIAERIAQLGISGVFQQREFRRYYPAGEVMAHVIGFAGVDDTGQEGIELAHDQLLIGKPGSRRVIKDRLGHIIEDVESIRAPQDGKDLALSIDSKIQYLAFSQLRQAVIQHKAKAAGIVVLDVHSGEILALANLPSYNPNNRVHLSGAQLRNRVFTDTFEPGSTLKPFTIATALEAGKVRPNTIIQTAPGQLTIGHATISDAHPGGAMTVEEIIQKSSNVGAAKIALSLPAETMWRTFDRVGFGHPPDFGFPGAVAGRVRAAKSWRPIEQATMAYGHGISVSLVQLARAYMVFARDGDLIPLSLTRIDSVPGSRSVISADNARAVRRMLERVVGPGGTAPKAQIMGYRVAGKTGTAHKQEGHGYAEHRYIASFVGFAPASDPRVVIAVMVDEPSNGQYFGGAVAAPVFASVMAPTLRILGVAPDAPLQPVELAPPGSEIKESM